MSRWITCYRGYGFRWWSFDYYRQAWQTMLGNCDWIELRTLWWVWQIRVPFTFKPRRKQ